MPQKTVKKNQSRTMKKKEAKGEKFTIDNLPPMFGQRVLAMVLDKSEYWVERARWAKNGPPYLKIGGGIRYTREGTLAWIASCQVNYNGGKK